MPDPDFVADSVAGIIVRDDGRYLLQHREDRAEVSYPGWWCLFGGAREPGESLLAAFRREMKEEIGLDVRAEVFMNCTYERFLPAAAVARKSFFEVRLSDADIEGLVLLEGAGMAWFDFAGLLAIAAGIVPYDIGALAAHRRLRGEARPAAARFSF